MISLPDFGIRVIPASYDGVGGVPALFLEAFVNFDCVNCSLNFC